MYVDEELCCGCGACVEACPRHALSIVDYKAVIDPARCDSCGQCVEACPQEAIGTTDITDSSSLQPPARQILPPGRAGALPTYPLRAMTGTQTAAPLEPAPGNTGGRLDWLGQVCNGVLAIAGFLLDRKSGEGRAGLMGRNRPLGNGAGRCDRSRRGGRGQGQGQGQGRGQGHRRNSRSRQSAGRPRRTRP
jgi:ferredoxin